MSMDLFSVAELVVVVTGAARGNGRAIAEGFLSAGARVVAVDRLELEFDDDCSGRLLCLRRDLVDPHACEDVLEQTAAHFGGIDCLINNAGISLSGTDPYSEDMRTSTFQINLDIAWRLSVGAAKRMAAAQGGAIINITSLGAVQGFPQNPSYQASKAALRQLSKAMARDFGGADVRVNNLCPGYIRTSMTQKSYEDPHLHEERLSHMMLGRWGEAKDLVGPCLFLASPAAAYITGIDLPVDGGWLAKGL
jgi:NAD(P)-dependent dehydrogenase (short-subunit alcohol dehydrogenase family)